MCISRTTSDCFSFKHKSMHKDSYKYINSSFYNQSKVLKSFSIQITSKIKKDQYFFLNVSVFLWTWYIAAELSRKREWKLVKVEVNFSRPASLTRQCSLSPPLLLYKFSLCNCVRTHSASATSPTAPLMHRESSEMSDSAKPLTSFLIEDILSNKDSARFNDKCCSQKEERCSQWNEESGKFSPQLCLQETAFGLQTGERLQAFNSRVTALR